MSVELTKEIRRAVDTGEVLFGHRAAEKSILKGKGQIVIVSKNCPQTIMEKVRHYSETAGIPFLEAEQSALELGSVCGKPFLVSTLLVVDTGKSKVLDAMQQAVPKTKKASKKRKPVAKKTRKKTASKAVKPKKSASRKAAKRRSR